MLLRALLAFALLASAGCRRGQPDSPDPSRPGDQPVCPEGPHLVVALQALDYEASQALLRFTPELTTCRGVLLSDDDGTVTTVGGLPSGADVVGFQHSYNPAGALVILDGDAELARVTDEAFYPISVASVTFADVPAVAVVWGTRSSSDHGERLDVYAASDLTHLAGWEVSYELTRVAAAPSDDSMRLAGAVGAGMQVYRAEASATTLPTTGELQVSKPTGVGYLNALAVDGEHVRAATDDGVLSWRVGLAPAFLGPVRCRWPFTRDTPLPEEGAEYVSAVIDPEAPEETLVLVDGALEGGEPATHLFRLWPRGECALVTSISSDYRAVAVAWSGR